MIVIDNTVSIQETIDNCSEKEIEIYLKKGIYNEKLYINKANVKLYGEDKEEVIIQWDDASDTVKRDGSDGTYGTTGSATVTILSEAIGFKAKNITFKNSFDMITACLKISKLLH